MLYVNWDKIFADIRKTTTRILVYKYLIPKPIADSNLQIFMYN